MLQVGHMLMVHLYSLVLKRKKVLKHFIQINTGGSNNESDNYGYSIYGNPEFSGNWYFGKPGYEISNSWNYSYREKIWRLNKHKGIPFTQYEYAKPN